MDRTPDLLTLFEYLRPAGAVNGAVHTAATEQSGVRSVDDRGYILPRDITYHDQNTSANKRFYVCVTQRVAQF